MTDIYLELGGKKVIAWSLDWPGWCRIRTSEEAVIQALVDTEPRYLVIAQRAGLDFSPGDLVVVERLPGDANTAWGVPSKLILPSSRTSCRQPGAQPSNNSRSRPRTSPVVRSTSRTARSVPAT
jgi:hypothetical protein